MVAQERRNMAESENLRVENFINQEEILEEPSDDNPLTHIRNFENAMDMLGEVTHLGLSRNLAKGGGISAQKLKELYNLAFPNEADIISE